MSNIYMEYLTEDAREELILEKEIDLINSEIDYLFTTYEATDDGSNKVNILQKLWENIKKLIKKIREEIIPKILDRIKKKKEETKNEKTLFILVSDDKSINYLIEHSRFINQIVYKLVIASNLDIKNYEKHKNIYQELLKIKGKMKDHTFTHIDSLKEEDAKKYIPVKNKNILEELEKMIHELQDIGKDIEKISDEFYKKSSEVKTLISNGDMKKEELYGDDVKIEIMYCMGKMCEVCAYEYRRMSYSYLGILNRIKEHNNITDENNK